MSEHAEIEAPADHVAKLLDHPKRITQQVSLHGGKLRRAYQRTRWARRGELGVEAQRHQEIERLGELQSEVSAERSELHQLLNALGRAGFRQAALQRQAAHAVHDGEDAAFLEVDRVASP